MSSPAGTAAPASSRLAWVDATRGYSVVAVVVFHVVLWHYLPLATPHGPGARVWGEVNSVLGSVRMPVLLAVSGLVLSRRLRTGLHRATTGFRAASNLYLYVVWLLVYALFYLVVRGPGLPHRLDPGEVLPQLVLPDTTLWYLFALAVYVVVVGALHRVPPWAVLLGAAALSVATHAWRLERTGVDVLWIRVPELLVFFAIGVYGAPLLRTLAARASALLLLVTAGAAVVVTLGGRIASDPWSDGVLFVARGTAFLAASVVAIALLTRVPALLRLGAYLGRRTLSIYVLHPLLLALLLTATAALDVTRLRLPAPVDLLYPAVVTAAVVGVAVLVEKGLRAAHLGVLLEPPARVRAAFGRPAA